MARPEIVDGDVTLESGRVLTPKDFEAMADEAERVEPDIDAVLERVARRGGRPPLGDGPSSVLQVRLDAATRAALTARADAEHRTPSALARDAIRRFLDAS